MITTATKTSMIFKSLPSMNNIYTFVLSGKKKNLHEIIVNVLNKIPGRGSNVLLIFFAL